MKWLRFAHQGRTGFGVVDQDRIAVHQGEMFGSAQATGEQLALAEVQVLAPCEPRQCFALWNNFRAAAAKNNWAEPGEPLYFLKGANSYSHHLAPVPKPRHYDGRIIYEAELAVVIGRGGRHIPAENALAHVAGYTCMAENSVRDFQKHNAQVTLMRTTPAECAELGRILAEKLNRYPAPVTFLIPRRAISVISAAGKPFHDPAADEALFSSVKAGLRPDIPVVELDVEINDPAFARACAETLLRSLGRA